ncbi:unnamed protein product [Cylicocyclus nassatus]|uniref:Uncharacterized protein n=1 Tax=Cylicocyclus nassatus TaxID=53992 RepID=A0AA36M9U0_CYLNA|nr:unnamed protein product [Cylicocyclus nassatus]
MRELEMEKGRMTDLQKENEMLFQDLVSARRYLPIQRGIVDERYYSSPYEVLQELILCHLERQNVIETTIDIDAEGYGTMTILLLNGSEYLRCEMRTSNGVCLTFRRASLRTSGRGITVGTRLGFGVLTIVNRGKTCRYQSPSPMW